MRVTLNVNKTAEHIQKSGLSKRELMQRGASRASVDIADPRDEDAGESDSLALEAAWDLAQILNVNLWNLLSVASAEELRDQLPVFVEEGFTNPFETITSTKLFRFLPADEAAQGLKLIGRHWNNFEVRPTVNSYLSRFGSSAEPMSDDDFDFLSEDLGLNEWFQAYADAEVGEKELSPAFKWPESVLPDDTLIQAAEKFRELEQNCRRLIEAPTAGENAVNRDGSLDNLLKAAGARNKAAQSLADIEGEAYRVIVAPIARRVKLSVESFDRLEEKFQYDGPEFLAYCAFEPRMLTTFFLVCEPSQEFAILDFEASPYKSLVFEDTELNSMHPDAMPRALAMYTVARKAAEGALKKK